MLRMDPINIDERFSKSRSQLLLNDLVRDPEKDLKDTLYSVLPSGGEIESYPHCQCNHWRYEDKLGLTCPRCGTVVEHSTEQDLESLFYIAKPAGVDTFINPKVYIDLAKMCWIGQKSFNPIYFLTISNYRPAKDHKAYRAMLAWGVERSWNYFTKNLRELVPRVLELITSTTSRKMTYEMQSMIEFVNYSDELVFCSVLPVINKLILAIEQTGEIKRRSPTTEQYGLAVTDLIALPLKAHGHMSVKEKVRIGNIVGKCYRGLEGFFNETYKREGKKGGLCRSDTLGLRSPFTWRAVITQIPVAHGADELHMPWTASTYLFEPQILRLLGDERMSPEDMLDFLEDRRRVYCPKLDAMFKQILLEFTDRGAPSYHVRYPTLYSQSGQLQYITTVKTNPQDKTVSVPAGALAGWCGDFDGRQCC